MPSGAGDAQTGPSCLWFCRRWSALLSSLQFNWFSVGLGIFSLLIVAAYPFMKRITDVACIRAGACPLMGCIDGLELQWKAHSAFRRCCSISVRSCGPSAMTRSTPIRDKEDDALVGAAPHRAFFGRHTRTALMALYGGAIGFFAAAAFARAQVPHRPPRRASLAAGAHLYRQILVLDIDNPTSMPAALRVEQYCRLADLSWACIRIPSGLR
ncbi:hypothetical protein VXQ18_17180 [Brucella abortus]|nr:hypothetical protein [Brucella abortus]